MANTENSFDLEAALKRVAEGFQRRGTADKYSASMVEGKALIGDVGAGLPSKTEVAVNSPTVRAAQDFTDATRKSQEIVDSMSETASKISSIRKSLETGVDENNKPLSTFQKQELVYQMEGLHGQFFSQAQQNAFVKGEGLHEVDSLRQRVLDAHAQDKKDPLYERFGRVPSPFTQQLESELAKAQSAARQESEQILKSDPVVNSIMNETSSFIKNTTQRLNQQLHDEETTDKEFAALGSGFSTQMQELSDANSYANNMGILTIDEKIKQSKNLAKDQKARLVAETNSPSDLRELTLAGNPYAYNKIAFLEAKSRATPDTVPTSKAFQDIYREVQGDLTFVRNVTNSPDTFSVQYEAREKAKGRNITEIEKEIVAINSLHPKEAEARRASFALEAVKEDRKNLFLSNVDAWKRANFSNPDTSLGKLYAVARQKVPAGQPVDFSTLTSSLTSLNSADKASAMIELNRVVKESAYAASGDYLSDFASGLNLQKDISNAIAFSISKILRDITGLSLLSGETVPVPGQ